MNRHLLPMFLSIPTWLDLKIPNEQHAMKHCSATVPWSAETVRRHRFVAGYLVALEVATMIP